MIATTCDAMSYMPQQAPHGRKVPVKFSRTAEPTRGWFAQDSVLHKVSSNLMPLIGLAWAFADVGAASPSPARAEFFIVEQDAGADAMNVLLRELIAYRSLPHDWDGYDGQPASPRATLDALQFLQQLPSGLPIPTPMLSGSGTVGLYWDHDDYYASLEFEGDGTYTYLTDSPEGYGGADGVAAGTLPAELRRYLAALPVAE